MTDSELVSLAITVLAILAGTWMTSTRIGDLNDGLLAEIKATKALTDYRFSSIDRKLDEIIRALQPRKV